MSTAYPHFYHRNRKVVESWERDVQNAVKRWAAAQITYNSGVVACHLLPIIPDVESGSQLWWPAAAGSIKSLDDARKYLLRLNMTLDNMRPITDGFECRMRVRFA